MTSLFQKIRTFLKNNPEGWRYADVAAKIGEPADKVCYAVSSMHRRYGFLSREKVGDCYHYKFVRDARVKAYESNRLVARKKERAERRAKKAARTAMRRAMHKIHSQAAAAARDKNFEQSDGPAETVEQFLARGGVIEVLGWFDTSLSPADLADLFAKVDS